MESRWGLLKGFVWVHVVPLSYYFIDFNTSSDYSITTHTKRMINFIPQTYQYIKIFLFLSESKTSPAKTPKKVKVEEYKLTREQKSLIKNDEANKKVWDEAMESLSLGPVRMFIYLKLAQ